MDRLGDQLAGDLHEELVAVRDLLESARSLVELVESPTRREEWTRDLRVAEAPLLEGVAKAHGFDLEGFRPLLSETKRRVERVIGEIANPGSAPGG